MYLIWQPRPTSRLTCQGIFVTYRVTAELLGSPGAGRQVRLIINCAEKATKYQRGVESYHLHSSYHGSLIGRKWLDRVKHAIGLVLDALVAGNDVAIHCEHGPAHILLNTSCVCL